MLAAFQVLLKHYTGRERIVVGTDVANRNREETEGLIGFFVNQLVLYAELSGDPTFLELLDRTRTTTLGAYAHQDLPFEYLVDVLKPERSLSYAPLFQVKVALQNTPEETLELPELSLSSLGTGEEVAAKLDLTLLLVEDAEGLGCHFEYSTDLFDAATVERMARLFAALLQSIVAQPDAALSALEESIREAARQEEQAERKKRAESRFKLLAAVKPKPLNVAPEEMVRTEFLSDSERLPVIVSPAIDGLDMTSWAQRSGEFIETNLLKYGAILFRGFGMKAAPEFESFVQSISPNLLSDNGEHPRKSVSGNVYTPVFYPADQKVLWHNENSFNYQWPTKIWFGCLQPAEQGGETPIVDSRRVLARLEPRLKERFIEKGIMYVRNYGEGLGLPWRDVFRTSEKAEVESYCRGAFMRHEWKEGDRLRTSTVRPAVVKHPRTGELTWFNQAQHWHISCLDAVTRKSMLSLFAEEDLPRNCYYGDGTVIEDSVMQAILQVYQELEVSFPWQKGDILMLDNLLTAHARNSFAGERRILVAMGDMLGYGDV